MKRSHWEVESLPVLGTGGRFAFFQKALGTGHRRKAAQSSHSQCLNLPSASVETRHPRREVGLQTMNIFCVPCWQSNRFRVRDWLGATWEWLLFWRVEWEELQARIVFLPPALQLTCCGPLFLPLGCNSLHTLHRSQQMLWKSYNSKKPLLGHLVKSRRRQFLVSIFLLSCDLHIPFHPKKCARHSRTNAHITQRDRGSTHRTCTG